MLSYRHAYHAGNPADVLKHATQLAVTDYLLQKDKPIWYIDTHAGAGIYRLDSGHAAEHGEFREGIQKIIDCTDLPPMIQHYLDAVRAENNGDKLTRYPGSAVLAARQLRPKDRLWLHEMHPTDVGFLERSLSDRRVRIEKQDGLAALRGLLPPEPRRALVMIDPPYELNTEYRAVSDALRDALRRFATGTYLLWYPLLARREQNRFFRSLRDVGADKWLDARLLVRDESGPGMYGSGMFVINPPWTLADQLEEALPFLVETLGDSRASFSIETEGN